MRERIISTLLGVIGAIVGGLAGHFVCAWIARQGFYALVLPGAFVGLGCSLLARHQSTARGVACGVGAVALGLYTEWSLFPWLTDGSLGYFLAHLRDLKAVTWIMIGLGGAIAYYLGQDASYRRGFAAKPKPQEPPA